ncbi:MAG: hypothetical protein QF733_02635 [Phycisphaerales bacterium]|nr:hypothetical protein [Phycisphaerales bacterium]
MSEGGLSGFEKDLHPDLVARVRQWAGVPGLCGLLESLESQKRRRPFMDHWIEAMVADRLYRRGAELETEVQTPAGRTCDFRVRCDGHEWFLHVKRLRDDRAGGRKLHISPRLRVLEHIQRPFMVRVRWADGLDDDSMQQLVVRASDFLAMAKVGDELTVRDETGFEVGAVRVVGPWEGPHVSLAIGLPGGFIDETSRLRRLLDKAYRQFMPRRDNVVLVAGSRMDEAIDFESAVLGATEERWDAHPGKGGRPPLGRAADGFWAGSSRPESRICAWCLANPADEALRIDLHLREDPRPDPALAASVLHLLSDPGDDGSV